MLTFEELTYYDFIFIEEDEASYLVNKAPIMIFKNSYFVLSFWDKVFSGQNTSLDMLWNFDGVRVLYSVGRLFSEKCTVPSDYIYKWQQGQLKQTQTSKIGRPLKSYPTFEGIAVYITVSKIEDAIWEPVTSNQFTITLYPNFAISSIQ
jgi:hypothetical protein